MFSNLQRNPGGAEALARAGGSWTGPVQFPEPNTQTTTPGSRVGITNPNTTLNTISNSNPSMGLRNPNPFGENDWGDTIDYFNINGLNTLNTDMQGDPGGRGRAEAERQRLNPQPPAPTPRPRGPFNPNGYTGFNPFQTVGGLTRGMQGSTPTGGAGALMPFGGIGPQAGPNAPQSFGGGQINHDIRQIKEALVGTGGF
jgi:hypothetical protein